MHRRADSRNKGVRNGAWGEEAAANHLRRYGFEIVERNSCPVSGDRRLEIDIIAWDPKSDAMVFVEVKQHSVASPHARRLSRIDVRKKKNLRKACNAWRRANKWHGGFRFDVIEVYGTPEGGKPLIDHIEKVNLFADRGRFVKWS